MMSHIAAYVGSNAGVELIQCIADYLSAVQSEETKRQEIAAHYGTIVHALNQERNIILTYFHYTFAERRLVLEHCFELMDKAISEQDHESLNSALSTILGVIHENPLKDFETFKSRMSEPGFQIVL